MTEWVQPLPPDDAPPFVVDPDAGGAVDQYYPVGLWQLQHLARRPTVQVIFLSKQEDKVLAVFPGSVWNRQKALRILPQTALSRTTALEVVVCGLLEREVPVEDLTAKVWVGYLKPEFVEQVTFTAEDINVEYVFEAECAGPVLPSGRALAEAMMEHFSFVSANEGQIPSLEAMDGVEQGPQPVDVDEPGSEDVAGRISRLERMMESLNNNIAQMVPKARATSRPSALKATPKKSISAPSPRRQQSVASPKRAAARSSKDDPRFPHLDVTVVRAATQAGLGEEVLAQLNQLVLQNPKGSKMADINPRVTFDPLSDEDEAAWEQQVSAEECAESGAVQGVASDTGAVERALLKLTDIAQSLSEDRKKRSTGSKLDLALDHSGPSDSQGLGTGKRSAAARRALRSMLVDQPAEISAMIERLMWEDISSTTLTPGVQNHSFSCRAWMEHRSRIGSYKTLAHSAWGVAGALDALLNNNVASARARLGILMLQMDQTAVDGGNWYLSSELSLESPPPFSALEGHRQPNVAAGESPYSRILDPRWAELAVAHLREQEDFTSRRKALGKNQSKQNEETDPDSAARRRAKFKPKAKAVTSEAAA